METNLIDQGINLMLFGMGTVFVFLTVLVFATSVMSKLVNRLNPEPPAAPSTPTSAPRQNKSQQLGQPSANIVTAIEKAIAKHRAGK